MSLSMSFGKIRKKIIFGSSSQHFAENVAKLRYKYITSIVRHLFDNHTYGPFILHSFRLVGYIPWTSHQ